MAEIHFSTLERRLKIPDKIAKLVNLHANSGDYMKSMFREQFAYGHREILLKYVGLDFSTQLLGTLQHGVLGNTYVENFKSPRYLSGRKSVYWVYSKALEKIGRSQGNDNVIAIGAPWLYLRDSTKDRLAVNLSAESYLVMPSHSQSTYVATSTVFQKKQRAKSFRDIVGSKNATVCLHAIDFCDHETVEAYLDQGFNVICAGSSSQYPAWSDAANRIRTLHKLMTLMMSHTHLLTDDYGSHIFYGIDIGMQIGIFPEIRKYLVTKDISERKNYLVTKDNVERNNLVDESLAFSNDLVWLGKHFKDSLNQFTDSHKYQEIANEILGRDAVMSPLELLAKLDYRKNVYPISEVQPW